MRTITWFGIGALAACGAESSTGHETAGPPEILQVFARERVDGELANRLAYGDHEDIDPEIDDREVTAAVARGGQRIRIVVDELLQGNFLEEVACADGTWSTVPVGTDFDDVARCAGADLSRCEGICVGADGPVGILDENGDGAFDDTRLIEGIATVTCGGADVPVDPQRSYYQPSGSQLLSTGSVGTDSLGPAIVIVPAEGLPPESRCGITLDPGVVDRQGVAIGDTSAIGFDVEPFLVAESDPPTGAAEVELTAPDSSDAVIAIVLNAALEPGTLAGAVAVTADGEPVEDVAPVVSADDDATVIVTVPGGFAAGAAYEVTVAGVEDVFGDVLPETTITWTTREP